VGIWKIFSGNFPFNPEEEKHKDVKFLKSTKNSGTGPEKLLLSKRITEREWRFSKEELRGPER